MKELADILTMAGGAVSSIALPLIGALMFHDAKKRKESAQARQAEAQARAAEQANIEATAQEWKTLYEQRDRRVGELNAKIDQLYAEKEADRQRIRELQEKNTAQALDLQVLRIKECQVRGCKGRKPPSDY